MNRRAFLAMSAGSLASAVFPRRRACAQAAPRPNIVVIMADDMGFSDIGCYGGEIHTPHLDRLAAEGVRFTQFYNAARCCPTRASLLTGLYPHQAGMGRMVTRSGQEFTPGPYQGFLNDQCLTIAEALKPSGYKSYCSGKWHVGERPEHWPRRRGFDRYFGLISGGSSYWELLINDRNRQMALDDEPYTPPSEGFYMTDAITDHAVKRIEEHDTSAGPFFYYVPYTAPHWPLHAYPEDIEKYRGKYMKGWDKLREERYARMIEMGLIDAKWPLSPRDEEVPPWDEAADKEDWDLRMAVYAAMIDRMDQGIGRILDALRRTGQEENTLVLFLSDNGGCHESVEARNLHQPGTKPGERGSFVAYKRPWANASNTPFRLFKHWVHEGGSATPLIARWPKGISERGLIRHDVGHVIDIMPTCLELAGGSYPATYEGRAIRPLEGMSLAPILSGAGTTGHRTLYWEHFGNRAIRSGKWKLVSRKDGQWELYDLEADRTELHDLSNERRDKAQDMLWMYSQWARKVGV